jgi:hypothetical protein
MLFMGIFSAVYEYPYNHSGEILLGESYDSSSGSE